MIMNRCQETDCYIQNFSVSFDYPVYFTRGVLAEDNDLLARVFDRFDERRRHRTEVFIDSGVLDCYPEIVKKIEIYFARHADTLELVCEPHSVPGGEKAKNARVAAESVMESIADQRLCRQSFVLAIGGGSALDIVGLAASLVHRGVRVIRIPTTVLAQDDSGVGIKTGIDAYGVKNFAGTFAPPFAVLIDYDFLDTLEDRYWIGGISEAYKVAIIRDAEFFKYLHENAAQLRARDSSAIEQVVKRSAILHLEHIAGGGDPFEFGTARPLDFGHWSAHRLEVLSGYEIGHGQAVSIGLALDSYYAYRTDHISEDELHSILTALRETGLPVWSSVLERKGSDGELAVLKGIEEFREHLGGRLNVTLPHPIGARTEVHEIDAEIVKDGIKYLGRISKEVIPLVQQCSR